MSAYILCATPGMGKSHLTRYARQHMEHGLKVVEFNSNHYQFIEYERYGRRTINPDWPATYVEAVLETALSLDEDTVILCSTHPKVINYLLDNKKLIDDDVDISIVCPLPTEECKEEYIQRHTETGDSTDRSIDDLKLNYFKYIDDVKSFYEKGLDVYFIDGNFMDFVYYTYGNAYGNLQSSNGDTFVMSSNPCCANDYAVQDLVIVMAWIWNLSTESKKYEYTITPIRLEGKEE